MGARVITDPKLVTNPVVGVTLHAKEVTNAILTVLEDFKNLETLDLRDTSGWDRVTGIIFQIQALKDSRRQ